MPLLISTGAKLRTKFNQYVTFFVSVSKTMNLMKQMKEILVLRNLVQNENMGAID